MYDETTNPIQSNPIQSNPIQSNPIQSYPIQSNPINPILSNPIQSNPINPILSYPIQSYPILSYPILSNPIQSYPILSNPILSSGTYRCLVCIGQVEHPTSGTVDPTTINTQQCVIVCNDARFKCTLCHMAVIDRYQLTICPSKHLMLGIRSATCNPTYRTDLAKFVWQQSC
jgi:hypothetical protein